MIKVMEGDNIKVSYKTILWKALCETTEFYLQRSTVHGAKFIVDPEGNKCSRFAWMSAVLVSFVISNVFVHILYQIFLSSPTRMNIESSFAVLPNLYFPAITICGNDYINRYKANQFVKKIKLPQGITERQFLSFLPQLEGFFIPGSFNVSELKIVQDIASANGISIVEFMNQLRPTCEDMLLRCRFEETIQECKDLVTLSNTFAGQCCSFNIQQRGSKFPAKRAQYHGIRKGFSFVLKSEPFITTFSPVLKAGVFIIVHTNYQFPTESTIRKLIPANSEVTLRLRPEEIRCSDKVKALAVEGRQCLFPDERTLRYFEQYDVENCDLECHITSIQRVCGCIPHYIGSVNATVCDFTKIPCLVNYYADRNKKNETDQINSCNCITSCNLNLWDTQTNVYQLAVSNTTIQPFYKDIKETNTVVHVFFNTQFYRRLRRDLLTNFISLMSNLGGIYGLFLGTSIISVLEIFFYFIVLLYGQYKEIEYNDTKAAVFAEKLKQLKVSSFKKFNRKKNIL